MNKRPQKLVLIAVLGLTGICLVGALCAGAFFLIPLLPNLLAKPVPTPACIEPRLSLGSANFQIQSLARTPDDSVQVPPNSPGVAFWVDGTSPRYVFTLSPTDENQGFGTRIQPGDTATIVWADCEIETYVVTGAELGTPEISTLLNQPPTSFTLFIRSEESAITLVIHAERPEILNAQTPASPEATGEEPEGIQAEIAFGDSGPTPDGLSYQMVITVKNTGHEPLAILPDDISLTPENGQPMLPTRVLPILPVEIAPGQSLDLTIVFPMPEGATALFRILDFTVDLYF